MTLADVDKMFFLFLSKNWKLFEYFLLTFTELISTNINVNDSCVACRLILWTTTWILIPLLYISALASFKPGFPAVINPYIGTDVTIDSRVSVGSVAWYKNAVKIRSSFQNPRLSVVANGSLLVRNVSEADDGLYQAFARTPVNEISSPPVQLHVVGQ